MIKKEGIIKGWGWDYLFFEGLGYFMFLDKRGQNREKRKKWRHIIVPWRSRSVQLRKHIKEREPGAVHSLGSPNTAEPVFRPKLVMIFCRDLRLVLICLLIPKVWDETETMTGCGNRKTWTSTLQSKIFGLNPKFNWYIEKMFGQWFLELKTLGKPACLKTVPLTPG